MTTADARWVGCFLAGFAVGLTVWFSSIVDSPGEGSYDYGGRALVLAGVILSAYLLALIGKRLGLTRGWLAPIVFGGSIGVVMPLLVTLMTLTTNGFSG
jgi:hypothetical protein